MSKTTNNTQVATLMPDIFADIDFSALNSTITNLGANNKELSKEEKKFAVEAIDSWEEIVIKRLNERAYEARMYIASLDINSGTLCHYNMSQADFENLVDAVGLRHLYEDYLNKIDIMDAHKLEAPEPPIIDELNMTLKDQLTLRRDYELAYQIHSKERDKLQKEAYNAMRKLKIELNKDERVQELIKRMSNYERKVNTFVNQCKEKSQLAKISVSIDSEKVRDSLKELMNFSINIQ